MWGTVTWSELLEDLYSLGETPVEDCRSKPFVLARDSQDLLFLQALFPILLLCLKGLFHSPLLCPFYLLFFRFHLLLCH